MSDRMKMFSYIYYYFFDFWFEIQDKRTQHIVFLNTSLATAIWQITSFLLWVTVVAPNIMKNLKPLEVRRLMLVYNIIMTIFNSISFFGAIIYTDYGRVFLDFKYPDRNDFSEEKIKLIHLGYCYYLTKYLDLLDTNFFIVRKKWDHLTFLHLYHHTVVPLFGWMTMKLNPVFPASLLFAIINSFVHILMYSYYALAALGPNIKKYLWWKKYLTLLQLCQFVIYAIYAFLIMIFQTGYPKVFLYFGLIQPPFFFWMFYDFYKKAYHDNNIKIKNSEKSDERSNQLIHEKQH